MAYKRHFDLDMNDIELLEHCLQKEVSEVSRRLHGQAPRLGDELRERLESVRALLGKLHNQKIWYTGKGQLARVPRG